MAAAAATDAVGSADDAAREEHGVYHNLRLEHLAEIMIVMVMARKMVMMMAKCNVNHRVMKPLCRKSLLTPWMSSSASNPQTDYLDPDRRVKLLFSRFGFGLSTQYGAEISKKLIVWWDLQIPKFRFSNPLAFGSQAPS